MPVTDNFVHSAGILDDKGHVWFEETHQEETPSTAIWTNVSHVPGHTSYILFASLHDSGQFGMQVGQTLDSRRSHHAVKVDETEELRQRLDNANNHFRWKAAEVLGDEDAVRLLIELYQQSTIRIAEFDACQDGISLARLTAANFCEVGANLIYITEAGQRFIESLDKR